MSRNRRTPPTIEVADDADLATGRAGAREPCAPAAKSDLHRETPTRDLAAPRPLPDEAYWQRVIERATD